MPKITAITFLLFTSFFTQAQFLQPIFEQPLLLENLNSDAEESIPLMTSDGESIYYHRTYFEENEDDYDVLGRDIWFAEGSVSGAVNDTITYSKKWKRPYRLFRDGEVEGVNDIIGVSENGSKLYLLNTTFTRDTFSRQVVTLKQKSNGEWEDQYTALKIPGLLFDGRRIELRMNENEDVLLVSMTPSKRAQYEDLYVSVKQANGQWTSLASLGDNINTPRTEIAPYLAKDNKTLYFTSDGHEGLGNGDIFMSKRLDNSWQKWTRPLNLGEPINSEGFDGYFLMHDGLEVYFASDRNSAFYDLYATVFTGKYSSANAEQISGEFKYQSLPVAETKLEIYDTEGNLIDIVVTDEEGKFEYSKLKSDEDYFVQLQTKDPNDWQGAKIYLVNEKGVTKRYILAEKNRFIHDKKLKNKKKFFGYFALNNSAQQGKAIIIKDENNVAIDTIYTDEKGGFEYEQLAFDDKLTIVPEGLSEEEMLEVDLFLTDEKGNKLHRLMLGPDGGFLYDKNAVAITDESQLVFFDFNSVILAENAKQKIQAMLSNAKQEGVQSIHLVGHADEIGTNEINYEVGLDRAKSVQAYLATLGYGKSKVTIESKGKTMPIAPNDDESRAKNRRVEVNFK